MINPFGAGDQKKGGRAIETSGAALEGCLSARESASNLLVRCV